MAKKPKTVLFSELSIMEILSILGNPFCSEQRAYYQYGKDHRAAWDAMRENKTHYDRVCDFLGLRDCDKFPPDLLKAFMKFMKPSITEDTIKKILNSSTNEHWYLEWDDGETDESQYTMFINTLFEKVKAFIDRETTLGFTVVKELKSRKRASNKK